jgi:serine/threonine protein kinase
MKKRPMILCALLLSAGIAFFYVSDYMDRSAVVLKDGNVILADQTWQSGDMIFYEIENEVFIISKLEVKSFGKPDLESTVQHARFLISRLSTKTNSEFKKFVQDTTHSIIQNTFWVMAILAFAALSLIIVLVVHLTQRRRRSVVENISPPHEEPAIETISVVNEKEGVTQSDIINYFLNLFRHQIGADPQAPMNATYLSEKSSGTNFIYELRILHRGDWMRRRMSIGPLGDEAGSKSKCFYVIYDVHLVIKIPVKPITQFDAYIESIKREGHIVDKLAPKECIIPRVSVVLNLINKLPESDYLPADKLEEKYVQWLRRNTDYQKYLKIKNTFVFFMDFAKYYFLSHIVDSLHDVKDAIATEIMENAETIFDGQKFRGRYGKAKESIGIEIRQVYNYCQAAIRQFLSDSGVSSNISVFRIQSWFLLHLAGKAVSIKESGFSDNIVKELNLLIQLNLTKHMDAVKAYRETINDYVYKIRFEQNKPQVAGIITNLLELLAWLRTKHIAMRDLKPDNLLVAGDPSKFPLFLMNAGEYELGIIDVETAVDFEKSKYRQIKQPLLGGTPFYATPSHFFSNEVLTGAFHSLAKILHLQDWHATMVMIFKTVTGELMFEKTARFFADIRNKIRLGQMEGMLDTEIVADISRSYWRSALLEFKSKMNQKENGLKAIFFAVPQNAKEMINHVLAEDIKATADKIKQCINLNAPNFFENPQSQDLLLKASPEKINQLQLEFENKIKSMPNSSTSYSGAIPFLKYLRILKLHAEQQTQLLRRLSQPNLKLSAYALLGFMFNNLYKSMCREEWWVKTNAAGKYSGANVDETTLEETV